MQKAGISLNNQCVTAHMRKCFLRPGLVSITGWHVAQFFLFELQIITTARFSQHRFTEKLGIDWFCSRESVMLQQQDISPTGSHRRSQRYRLHTLQKMR